MTDVKQPEGRKPVVENAVLHTPIVIESPCIRMVGKDGSVHVSCSHAAALAAPPSTAATPLREWMEKAATKAIRQACPHDTKPEAWAVAIVDSLLGSTAATPEGK